MSVLVVITDSRRICGIRAAAAPLGEVVALVVGNQELAREAVEAGFDRVALLEPPAGVPAVSLRSDVAAFARKLAPQVVLSNDAAASRMLAAAAAGPDATVVGAVVALASAEGATLVTQQVESGNAATLQDLSVAGPLLGVFAGEEADPAPAVAQVESLPVHPGAGSIIGTVPPIQGAVDLSAASRIVGIGRGLKSKDDLAQIEALAERLGAVVGCTLPVCDDLHWYGPDRVIGSSHNQAGPQLYFAFGVQGAPNHVAGVRDAGCVIAVNKDPEASIFKSAKYGIVGDLYEIIPELLAAL